LGLHTEKNPTARRVIIRELDGKRITYLDDFIKVAHSIDDGTYTTVMYQDLFSVNTAPKVAYTSFDLMFSGLRIVELSDGSGNWEEVK
jgi:hypothetical protein